MNAFLKKRKRKITKRRTGRIFIRKRRCRFCSEKIDDIGYKNVARLERFITERGKILPSRITGTCAKHQRRLARAIKRARAIALIPYIAE